MAARRWESPPTSPRRKRWLGWVRISSPATAGWTYLSITPPTIPKVEAGTSSKHWSRFENFPLEVWDQDIAVGLTGAFLCSQVSAAAWRRPVAASSLTLPPDLGLIAPDQRILPQSRRNRGYPERQAGDLFRGQGGDSSA